MPLAESRAALPLPWAPFSLPPLLLPPLLLLLPLLLGASRAAPSVLLAADTDRVSGLCAGPRALRSDALANTAWLLCLWGPAEQRARQHAELLRKAACWHNRTGCLCACTLGASNGMLRCMAAAAEQAQRACVRAAAAAACGSRLLSALAAWVLSD